MDVTVMKTVMLEGLTNRDKDINKLGIKKRGS